MTADHAARVRVFLDATEYHEWPAAGATIRRLATPTGDDPRAEARLSTADLAAVLDELKTLRNGRAILLPAVGAVLWEHIGVLSGPWVDADLAELAHVWLAAGPDDPETEAEVRARLNDKPEPETCRPVTVTDNDGETVTVRVHGGREMGEQETVAFGEVIRATQRMHVAKLKQEREDRESDVRAVAEACAGVLDGTTPQPTRHEYAVRRLHARFADRIAALDAAAPQQPEHDGGN